MRFLKCSGRSGMWRFVLSIAVLTGVAACFAPAWSSLYAPTAFAFILLRFYHGIASPWKLAAMFAAAHTVNALFYVWMVYMGDELDPLMAAMPLYVVDAPVEVLGSLIGRAIGDFVSIRLLKAFVIAPAYWAAFGYFTGCSRQVWGTAWSCQGGVLLLTLGRLGAARVAALTALGSRARIDRLRGSRAWKPSGTRIRPVLTN